MDWNDPDELRRLRDQLGRRPGRVATTRRARPARSPTPSRCSSGASGCPSWAARYFTFSNENNDLIWGFLAECHRRGWLYKGHDTMPWCARCGTGLSPDGDERGLPGPDDPGLTVALPARRPARRVAAGLDHDALDAHGERGRRRRAGAALRPGSPGRAGVLAGQGNAQPGASSARSRCSRSVAGRSSSAGATRSPSTTCPRSGRRVPPAGPTDAVRAPRRRLGRGRRGRGDRDRPHRARAAAPRTTTSARRLACPSSRPSTRPGASSTGSGA